MQITKSAVLPLRKIKQNTRHIGGTCFSTTSSMSTYGSPNDVAVVVDVLFMELHSKLGELLCESKKGETKMITRMCTRPRTHAHIHLRTHAGMQMHTHTNMQVHLKCALIRQSLKCSTENESCQIGRHFSITP